MGAAAAAGAAMSIAEAGPAAMTPQTATTEPAEHNWLSQLAQPLLREGWSLEDAVTLLLADALEAGANRDDGERP
jgi:hypothetical protein